MIFSCAAARSRYKWILCCLMIFILFCLHYQYSRNARDSNAEDRRDFDASSASRAIKVSTEEDKDETVEPTSTPTYFVESEHCKIPYIHPFAAEALKVYKPVVFEKCSNESDLVTPIFDMNSKRYILHINESVAAEALNSTDIEFNCFYREIIRKVNGDTYDYVKTKIYFSQGYVVPLHVHGMILECYEAANSSNVIQKDALSFIQYKPLPPENPKSGKMSPRKPSVIMFGIDSISRINLRRTMPKVSKFLTRSGWYEMQGYNKVGDNTFPNLMAVLTGYLGDSADAKVCNTDEEGCFDRIPFIWKYLKNASYLTAYAEDEYGLNTFNYIKPGFVEPPTDYYYRPLIKGFARQMKRSKCTECTMTHCIGRRVQSSYVYDYGRNFAKRYVAERPIWGLFWSSSFSHDDFALPSMMDDMMLQYLKDFETDGVLEESIFIFFADHGARYGTLSHLSSGFLEERLPMLFIYLPPWFRAQYPEYAQALQDNRNRLTSNFDLHNTLKHIIEIGQEDDLPPLPKANDCPKCHSLFYPINQTRSCIDAGISEHYCTCEPYMRTKAKWAQQIAPLVIERINGYLRHKGMDGLCANLTLDYIHKTEIKLELAQDFNEKLPRIDVGYYRTMFKVKQNSADFFATVIYNNVTHRVDVDVETISRTNSYEEDSPCIYNKIAKLYCICKAFLKP